MPFSTTYANRLLNYTLAKSSQLEFPDHVYIGLSYNDPEADGGTFNEVKGDTYERIIISLRGAEEPNVIGTASNRSIQNTRQINWIKASIQWGEQIKGFGLFDSLTGGSPFFYGALETPVTVEAGDVALFDPGTLKISFPATDVSTT